jgi:MFS family permease
MQLIGVVLTVGVIDRFGRKPILYFGSFMCLACHATIAGLIGTYSSDWASNQEAALAGVAMICIFMFIFGTSWSPLPWAIPPEVMPSTFRAKGVSYATVSNWVRFFFPFDKR